MLFIHVEIIEHSILIKQKKKIRRREEKGETRANFKFKNYCIIF